MKYINDHREKFYGPASVLELAFLNTVLPEDFKLPSSVSILERGAFNYAIFPENCKETFSGILDFKHQPFELVKLPKSYSPSIASHGGGSLGSYFIRRF